MSMQSLAGARFLAILGSALLLVSGAEATPETDAASRALAAIEEGALASNSDAVLVMRHGEVLLERYGDNGPQQLELMSVTKSVVALAVGALVDEGRIESLDQPVHAFFPEWKQGRKAAITVRMLMDHTSGLQDLQTTTAEIYPAPDVIQLALAAELSHDPGTRFFYSNKAVNLLAGIIERAAGEPMDRYIQRRLLDPMGVRAGEWERDSVGNPHVMAGLSLDARGAAAVGELVLGGGEYRGGRLVSADFIDEMLAPSQGFDGSGLLWWRKGNASFHADAESLALIERAGVSPGFLAALRALEGRQFATEGALDAALSSALGDGWREAWGRELIVPHGIGPWRPFHPQEGPVDVFLAQGWRGQFIVVMPKAGLVAVRQIRSRDEHAPGDDFPDFIERIRALANALAAAP